MEVEPIKSAILDVGYRCIDTACKYQNEEVVGQAIEESIASGKVAREDLYIITKLWLDNVEDVQQAIETSLKKLRLSYVDLYMIHWPGFTREISPATETSPAKFEKIMYPVHKVWPQMESLVEQGLAKSIGVSNFSLQMVWDLLSYCKI